MPSPTSRSLIVLSIVALVATACSPAATATPGAAATTAATSAPATSAAGGDGTVRISLQEFTVIPVPDSASAGDVTFEVTNSGTVEHEFVVIKTDLAPDKLPKEASGEVDEDGAGIDVVDEVEEMPVGETNQLKVNLAAGSYVLICNVVNGETSHYANGMRVAFTVN